MSLKCGIVGLPNVGKSTLFNALTQAGIAAENYPFCTIEPNTGVVEVPDPRLAQLAAIVTPQRVVPAIVEFVDIAGLGQRIEQGGFSDVGQANDAALEAHGFSWGRVGLVLARWVAAFHSPCSISGIRSTARSMAASMSVCSSRRGGFRT